MHQVIESGNPFLNPHPNGLPAMGGLTGNVPQPHSTNAGYESSPELLTPTINSPDFMDENVMSPGPGKNDY